MNRGRDVLEGTNKKCMERQRLSMVPQEPEVESESGKWTVSYSDTGQEDIGCPKMPSRTGEISIWTCGTKP